MNRNLLLVTLMTAAGISAAGMGFAETQNNNSGMTDEQMFQSAKVSLAQATEIAKKELPGTLSSIGFNAENGKGMYEGTVVGTDGVASIIKIDADTGAVLGKGLVSAMDDEGDENGQDHEGSENGENSNG